MSSPGRLIKIKYHRLILCDCEKDDCKQLTEYLDGRCRLYFSRPKGIKKKFWCQGIMRPTQAIIDVITALINFHVDVYQEGYTSNGQLSIEDFYWLSRTKTVKISDITFKDVMVQKTEAGTVLDFKSLSRTITIKVFRTLVPKEPRHLLERMTKDPIHHLNLIKHNIILLGDEEKVGRYIMLHQKLVLAKQLDEKMYTKALENLKCGVCKEIKNWQTAIFHHAALLKVFNYKREKILPDNEEGAGLFGRHCCHHLTKYALDDEEEEDNSEQNKSSTDAEAMNIDAEQQKMKFSLADIFPLLECFIPGLFSQLQEGVFEIIELLYPEELLKLKNKKTGGA